MLRSISDLKIGKSRVLCEMKNRFKWFSSFFIYFHEMKSRKCSGSIPGFWGFTVSTLAGVGSARECWNPPSRCKAFAPQIFFLLSQTQKNYFWIFQTRKMLASASQSIHQSTSIVKLSLVLRIENYQNPIFVEEID